MEESGWRHDLDDLFGGGVEKEDDGKVPDWSKDEASFEKHPKATIQPAPKLGAAPVPTSKFRGTAPLKKAPTKSGLHAKLAEQIPFPKKTTYFRDSDGYSEEENFLGKTPRPLAGTDPARKFPVPKRPPFFHISDSEEEKSLTNEEPKGAKGKDS